MGKYAARVTGLGYKPEDLRRAGYIFDADNPLELAKFKRWLRVNNLTLAVFFIILGGVFFTFFVSLAGYSARSIYHMELPSGWKIAIVMAEIFKSAFGQLGYIFFGIILIFALFDTQFTVYDGIARMGADAFFLEHPESFGKKSCRFLVLYRPGNCGDLWGNGHLPEDSPCPLADRRLADDASPGLCDLHGDHPEPQAVAAEDSTPGILAGRQRDLGHDPSGLFHRLDPQRSALLKMC